MRRENTLSVLRERLTFIFLGTALYDCQCMAYSLTRNYYTFLARPYPHTIRTKRGSSSDGRASALHAEGTGIDALLLQFVFYFLFLTGSRRDIGSAIKVIKRRSTIRRSALPSTFPGFLALREPLVFTLATYILPLGQSNSVFGIVRLKILSGEVSHAHASPGSNKRAKLKGGEARSKTPLRGTQARRGLRSIRIRSF